MISAITFVRGQRLNEAGRRLAAQAIGVGDEDGAEEGGVWWDSAGGGVQGGVWAVVVVGASGERDEKGGGGRFVRCAERCDPLLLVVAASTCRQ